MRNFVALSRRRLVAFFLFAFIASLFAATAYAEGATRRGRERDDTKTSLKDIVKKLCDLSKELEIQRLCLKVLTEFDKDRGKFSNSLRKDLRDALAVEKIEVVEPGNDKDVILKLTYSLKPEVPGTSKEVKIVVEYEFERYKRNGEGGKIPKDRLEGILTIDDLTDLLSANAVNGVIRPVSNKNARDAIVEQKSTDEKISESIANPSVNFRARKNEGEKTLVSASAEDKFAVEIRVDNKPLVPFERETKDGKSDGLAHVIIPKGKPYTIILYNLSSDYHAYATLIVDGINTQSLAERKQGDPPPLIYALRKQPKDAEKPVGSEIKGWFINPTTEKKFVVGDFEQSAAKLAGVRNDDADLGTITAIFGLAYDKDEQKEPGEPPAPKSGGGVKDVRYATNVGEEVKTVFKMVQRECGVVRSSITIHYEVEPEKPSPVSTE